MSLAKYNGITISDVLIESVDQETIFDNEGGVDPIYLLVRVTFNGVVRPGYEGDLSQLGVHYAGPLATELKRLQRRLNQPRRNFELQVGGLSYLSVSPAMREPKIKNPITAETTDVNNGPRTKVRINKVISGHSVHITMQVECAIVTCDSASASTPSSIDKEGVGNLPYTNLRFWMADDVDQHWYTTRTFHGRLRIGSKLTSPLLLRGFVIPLLQSGFLRQAQSYREDPSGLELEFTIVDQEVFSIPPSSAITWTGRHEIMSNDGVSMSAIASVQLTGTRTDDRRLMIGQSIRLLDRKLFLIDRRNLGTVKALIEYFSLSYEFHQNTVTTSVRVYYPISAGETTGTNALDLFGIFDVDNELGAVPTLPREGHDRVTARQPPNFPLNSLTGIFNSVMQNPCLIGVLEQGYIVPSPKDDGKSPNTPTPDTNYSNDEPLPPAYDGEYDTSHAFSQYLFYRISSKTIVDTGVIRLPIAGTPPDFRSKKTAASTTAFQLHQGDSSRLITIEAERLGDHPSLPSPVSFTDQNGIAHTLITSAITPVGPLLSPDRRTWIFRDQMKVYYELSRPPFVHEIRGNSVPYDSSNILQSYLPAEMFESPTGPRAIA
jgi:hypothetical protein